MTGFSLRAASGAVAMVVVGAVLAATGTAASTRWSAVAAPSCTSSSYAYAGLIGAQGRKGIKATVTALAPAQVKQGHVAAWIGVSGSGANGAAEWLQTGLNTLSDGTSQVYVESALFGSGVSYTTAVDEVEPGDEFRLAVLQVASDRDVWQVFVNGRAVGVPVRLAESNTLQPMAMSESWNGGTRACNGFAYRFERLQVASKAGSWRPLADASLLANHGYRVSERVDTGFVAHSG